MKKMSSGFCMCFVPVVSDKGPMVEDKNSKNSSSEVKPLHSPAMGSDEKDEGGGGSLARKNKHGRRSFARYFKAVLFETSLMKKMRSKKLGQKLHRIYNGNKSKSESETKPNKIVTSIITKAPQEDIEQSTRSNISSKYSTCLSSNGDANSSLSLSSSSSSSSLRTASDRSSSSSLSYKSRPLLTNTVGNNDMQAKFGKVHHGFSIKVCCLLIISLLVLVIWGKVCAIFCTSIVLVFANRWIKSIKPGPIPENIVVDRRLPEIDSELYKKKIIMEGLLERKQKY